MNESEDVEIGAPLFPTLLPFSNRTAGDADGPTPPEFSVGPPLVPDAPPFDPEPTRERVRSWLAIGLVGWTIALMLSIAGGVLFFGIPIEVAKELGGLLIAPSLGLAGAVTGFYYASRR